DGETGGVGVDALQQLRPFPAGGSWEARRGEGSLAWHCAALRGATRRSATSSTNYLVFVARSVSSRVAAGQRRRVPSTPLVAMRLPSREKAIPVTAPT